VILSSRFLADGFSTLRATFPDLALAVTIVDRLSPDTELRDRLSALRDRGIPVDRYVKDENFDASEIRAHTPSVIFVAIPPGQHFESLRSIHQMVAESASTTGGRQPIIAVEKPLIVPRDLPAAQELIGRNPTQIFDVDFFNQSRAFYWLMTDPRGQALLERLGTPAVINSNCVEKMQEWRRWIRQADISGGGMFLDCGSHNVHLIKVFLDQLAIQRGEAPTGTTPTLERVSLGSYDSDPTLRESYALARLSNASTTWHVQVGKGLPLTAYNLEVFSERGNYLLVSVGTETYPPFILFAEVGQSPQLIKFDGPGVGYDSVIYRLLALSQDRTDVVFPRPAVSMAASLLGPQLQVALEAFGETQIPYSVGEWPALHLPTTHDAFGRVDPL